MTQSSPNEEPERRGGTLAPAGDVPSIPERKLKMQHLMFQKGIRRFSGYNLTAASRQGQCWARGEHISQGEEFVAADVPEVSGGLAVL